MKLSKTRTVTLVACVCFAAAAASLLVNMIRYRGWGSAPAFAAAVLLIVGLARRSTLLLSAGALIRAVMALYALAEDYGIYTGLMPNRTLLLRAITTFAAAALLLALALSKRRSLLLGWLSGGCALLSTVLYYYARAQRASAQVFNTVSILLHVAAILGPILTGYARRDLPPVRDAWNKLLNKGIERLP